MSDVGALAAEVVVEADDFVPVFQQTFAKMGTEKPGAAGNQ